MRKILIIVLVLILAGAGVMYIKPSGVSQPDKPTIKIGVILPLTGDNAEVGENIRNIIQLYVKENAHKYDLNYDIIVEDDAFQTRNVATLAHKLVKADKVNGLITILAYAGLVASSITKDKVPHLNIATNTDGADGVYNFVNYTPLPAIQNKLSQLLKAKNVKTLALVAMNHVGPQTYDKHIKNAFRENDVVYKEYNFNPNERDFRLVIQEIKRSNPDMIMLMALPPTLDIWGKQIIEAEVNIPLTSVAFFSMSNYKEVFEGQVYIDGPDGTPSFVKKVNDNLHTDNLFLLAFAEDSIKIFMDITNDFYQKNGRVPTNAEIALMIKELKDFTGEVGTYSMGEDGVAQSKAVLKKIIDRKAVIIEE